MRAARNSGLSASPRTGPGDSRLDGRVPRSRVALDWTGRVRPDRSKVWTAGPVSGRLQPPGTLSPLGSTGSGLCRRSGHIPRCHLPEGKAMRNTRRFLFWLNHWSWKAGAAAALVMTLSLPALARQLPCGFTCNRQEDQSLECEAKGFSQTKRAPEWEISVDGRQVDRARGWRVVLYPVGSRVNTITLRAFVKDQELSMSGTWGKPAAESAPEQLATRQP
jgi:hypothetical protein